MFYVYKIGTQFLKVKGIDLSKARKIQTASYWESKKSALTWKRCVETKYPNAELVEAELTLKK